ncbi:hypothetical protein AVEN_225456-1 [Araneus ventricosus]|uniref:Uncharacterized protein n=1 Tax=Araneus ventricosus TaxID=182803 RepID=A0A4Y2TKA1_ARAVE|nr:hypothetical protein AVEN_225456-1 [Araneus ventricosus]
MSCGLYMIYGSVLVPPVGLGDVTFLPHVNNGKSDVFQPNRGYQNRPLNVFFSSPFWAVVDCTTTQIAMDLMHVTSHPPTRDLPAAASGQSNGSIMVPPVGLGDVTFPVTCGRGYQNRPPNLQACSKVDTTRVQV